MSGFSHTFPTKERGFRIAVSQVATHQDGSGGRFGDAKQGAQQTLKAELHQAIPRWFDRNHKYSIHA